MNNNILVLKKPFITDIVYDIIAISSLFILTSLSHTFLFPIYIIEPMRIVILFSLVFTSRTNSFILAISLPLFSYFTSSHPYLFKALIIGFELCINILLFYYLKEKLNNVLYSLFISIVISKIIYYLIKMLFINLNLINDTVIATNILSQIIFTLTISFVLYFIAKKKIKNAPNTPKY